jgi:oligopeptide transport system substrate-binding protein
VRPSAVVVAWLAIAGLVAACDGASGGSPVQPADSASPTTPTATASPSSEPTPEPSATARFVAAICEPVALVPANTDDCGRPVVGALFSQLVTLDDEGVPHWGDDAPRAMADTITTDDNQHWRIELKPDWVFHDGEPVTAASFAHAWARAASGLDVSRAAPLFEIVEGFEDLQCGEAGCPEESPTERPRLAGVDVVDDLTLAVSLREPRSQFPLLLSHVAFSPLPTLAFDDPSAFADAPVGNGPLRLDGAWERGAGITLVRFAEYGGAPAVAAVVELRTYEEPGGALADLDEGVLDLVTLDAETEVPDDLLADVDVIRRAGPGYTFVVVPRHVPGHGDPRIAHALSMALDRDALVGSVVRRGAVPARSLLPPGLAGDDPASCGAVCAFDPAAAGALWQEAGGVPGGVLTLYSNAQTNQRTVLSAIARQWEEHLPGLDVRIAVLSVTDLVRMVENQEIDGPYRLRWSFDVPTLRDYLAPLHGAGGEFNFDGYTNATVEDLIAEGDRAPTLDQAWAAYREAEQVVIDDGHHIPLWFDEVSALHSDRLRGVTLDVAGHVRLAEVEVVEEDATESG